MRGKKGRKGRKKHTTGGEEEQLREEVLKSQDITITRKWAEQVTKVEVQRKEVINVVRREARHNR